MGRSCLLRSPKWMIFCYEREYSVSRIGEDIQVSFSGNRGLELIPWDLRAQEHNGQSHHYGH